MHIHVILPYIVCGCVWVGGVAECVYTCTAGHDTLREKALLDIMRREAGKPAVP